MGKSSKAAQRVEANEGVVAELVELGRRAARRAIAAGAEAAEVVVSDGAELYAKVRFGEPELVHEAGARKLGLRVFRDRRAASTYTADLQAQALERFVDETVALAALAEPDELNELPPEEQYAREVPDLDLYDERVVSIPAEQAIRLAREGEAAARAYSDQITNSEGASYGRSHSAVALVVEGRGRTGSWDGFAGSYRGTRHSLTVEPLADDADGKKRGGYYWTSSRFLDGLEPADEVGREAARRTLAKLGAEKIPTATLPVVFDPEAGRALVRTLAGVLSGGAIYRGSSYLVGREGTPIASPLVTLVDDPLIPRGPGSRPFDGEGLRSRKNLIIEGGHLVTYLLDTYSARKLGRTSNGCGGGSGSVSTSNLIFRNGASARAQVLDVPRGLYVTEMMGFGFNAATGDFSRGAGGFLIENGQLTRPVSEVTISANFDDLLKSIDAVADDLEDDLHLKTSTACPTFRVAKMTIAGR